MGRKIYLGTDNPVSIVEFTPSVVRVSVPGTGKTLIFSDTFGALDYVGRHGLGEYIGKSSVMRECRWDDADDFANYLDALNAYKTAADYEGDADGQWGAIAELQKARRAFARQTA